MSVCPARRHPQPEIPSFDVALDALLSGRSRTAAALFAARALADPDDLFSRTNHAVAIYEQGRWAAAAEAFMRLIPRQGAAHPASVPMLFCLGYCFLELERDRDSLAATTGFLDHGNTRHPFYWAGVQNTACAWDRLGCHAEAAALYRAVLGHGENEEAYNGLALALVGCGLPREAVGVCEWATTAGFGGELVAAAREHAAALAGGEAVVVPPAARPWARRRIIETSYRILGWDAVPRPASRLRWGRR
jgi:hypothetical protein